MLPEPQVVFAQHGWDDNGQAIGTLAERLLAPGDRLVAPSLNRLQTWLRIAPLVAAAERHALVVAKSDPHRQWTAIGHSMGGLIWLEILNRHPEWWGRVRALVLIAPPLGGSDIARILDPGGWGIGIARDLGCNRRPLAEKIAAAIPMQIVASDLGNGSDGTVPLGATQCDRACWVCLQGITHAQLRYRPESLPHIRSFLQAPSVSEPATDAIGRLLRQMRALPGIVDTNHSGCARAPILREFPGGLALRLRSWAGAIACVYLSDAAGRCLYSGFVGRSHVAPLQRALQALEI